MPIVDRVGVRRIETERANLGFVQESDAVAVAFGDEALRVNDDEQGQAAFGTATAEAVCAFGTVSKR